MCEMCRYRSSGPCTKYHSGLCSTIIHSVVSIDSFSRQCRSWSDYMCRLILAIHVCMCLKDCFRMAPAHFMATDPVNDLRSKWKLSLYLQYKITNLIKGHWAPDKALFFQLKLPYIFLSPQKCILWVLIRSPSLRGFSEGLLMSTTMCVFWWKIRKYYVVTPLIWREAALSDNFCLPLEREPTLRGKNLLPLRANIFLSE